MAKGRSHMSGGRTQRSSGAQRDAPGKGTALDEPGAAMNTELSTSSQCAAPAKTQDPGCMNTGAVRKTSIFLLKDISNKKINKIE